MAQKQQEDEETSRLEREADKLRRQLKKVESSIKRKREQQDEGDEMRDSTLEEDSDNDKPEVQSSRAPDSATAAAAAVPSQPAKKADITRHCKYYSTGGSCGKKGKCRFVHDPAVREAAIREKEANNGQLTIKQRLILNDKDQEDLTVLESIQYLREKGLVKTTSASKPGSATAASPSSQSSSNKPSKPPKPVGSTLSTLPAPPPSLPAPPNRRENGAAAKSSNAAPYAGWNLGGYGGTGIKPEDLP